MLFAIQGSDGGVVAWGSGRFVEGGGAIGVYADSEKERIFDGLMSPMMHPLQCYQSFEYDSTSSTGMCQSYLIAIPAKVALSTSRSKILIALPPQNILRHAHLLHPPRPANAIPFTQSYCVNYSPASPHALSFYTEPILDRSNRQ